MTHTVNTEHEGIDLVLIFDIDSDGYTFEAKLENGTDAFDVLRDDVLEKIGRKEHDYLRTGEINSRYIFQ